LAEAEPLLGLLWFADALLMDGVSAGIGRITRLLAIN
jgi:hypothetical protein